MSIVFQEDLASSRVNGSFAIQQSRHELRLLGLSKQQMATKQCRFSTVKERRKNT